MNTEIVFLFLQQGIASGLVTGSVYALLALALVIVFRTTDVANFAEGEFYMAAAYLAFFLIALVGLPIWAAAMSFCGVRGATTLAGVLTLPLAMSDGSAFPSRELAIFLAMGVIITSLIVASIDLPLLLRGLSLPPEPSHLAQENAVRIAAAEAAVGLLLGKLFNSGDDALKILLPTSVPLVFLAGFAWPLQSMPGWLSALAWFSPATCAMHIFVPINQMGASLEDVFGPLAKLMALLALYGGLNIWSGTNSAR